ncbi:MAG: NUDIX domain-containing protein [Simkaniaceae bacterium]|nr:NUDIX domain-containing protein [Simkaniaceae bacterium]
MRKKIYELIENITPLDFLEQEQRADVLDWINSEAELFRTKSPAVPPKHLVSYSVVIDVKKHKILLADHKKAQLFLPTGGHVDPNEHPTDAAHRELQEELEVRLPLLFETPFFLTATETVGLTAGHIDVSLWYVFKADSTRKFSYDESEFHKIEWFSLNNLPTHRSDPHLARFCQKLLQAVL